MRKPKAHMSRKLTGYLSAYTRLLLFLNCTSGP